MNNIQNPSVLVMMSTYNGEKYLKNQIESILLQKKVNLTLLIRDDGSSDNTIKILKEYKFKYNTIQVIIGKNLGAAASFLQLVSIAGDFDYYAFSDQDDVWDQDKIISAIAKINYCLKPIVYYSDTRLMDNKGEIYSDYNSSIYPKRSLILEEFLLTNNCVGCTIVYNQMLMHYLRLYKPYSILMHDHWVCILCSSLSGDFVFDQVPHMSYRQHENNVVGANVSFTKRLKFSSLITGKNLRSTISREIVENYKNYINEDILKKLICAAEYKKNGKLNLLHLLLPYERRITRKAILFFNIIWGFY